MSDSSYRIPCVYCAGKISFPSSALLKEHLIAEHSSSVSPYKYKKDEDSAEEPIGKSYSSKLFGVPVQVEPWSRTSVTSGKLPSPASSQHLVLPESYSSLRSFNSITSQEDELAKVKSEAEVKINIAEQKVSQLSESLSKKSILIDRLQEEVDNLKSKLQLQEEEHKKLKQKWRREAEEAVRSWAAKYEGLGSKHSALEKQMAETEDELARLRAERDKMVTDMTDMQTRDAEMTKMQRMDFREQAQKIEQKLESERHVTKSLSTDLQSLRKENETLAEALAAKADSIKGMKTSLINVKAELTKEKEKNDLLFKEKSALTGELARLQIDADAHSINSSVLQDVTDSRFKRLQSENAELQSKLSSLEKANDANQKVVSTLQQEKQNLVHRLQEADESLSKLTTRVATPTRASSEKLDRSALPLRAGKRQATSASSLIGRESSTAATASIPFADEIRRNLDLILSAISGIHRRDMADTRKDAEAEINRLQIKLLEEQSLTRELRDKLSRTESLVDQRWNAEEGTPIEEELMKLQAKHSKCEKLRKDYKQRRKLKREKQVLTRKCSAMSHELQIQRVLYEQLEGKAKELGERLAQISQEKKTLKEDLTKGVERERAALEKRLETQKHLDKYKHENGYLLEKLGELETKLSNLANEKEQLQLRYSEYLCAETTTKHLQFLGAAVEKLETNLRKISSENLSMKGSVDDTKEFVKSFAEQNVQLSKELMDCRRCLILESKEKERTKVQIEIARQTIDEKLKQEAYLKDEIKKLETELAKCKEAQSRQLTPAEDDENGETEIVLHQEATIESLTLERDILSSRVVILESIREEIEILRNEKMRFQIENQDLRRQLLENNIEVPPPKHQHSTSVEIRRPSELSTSSSTADSVSLPSKANGFPKIIFRSDNDQSLSTGNTLKSESSADLLVLSAIPVDSISEAEKQSLVKTLASNNFESLLSKETVSICDHHETRVFKRIDSDEGEPSVEFLIERIQMDEAGNISSTESLEGGSSTESTSGGRAAHMQQPRDISSCFADDETNFSDEIDDTVEYVQKEIKMLTPSSSESSTELEGEHQAASRVKATNNVANSKTAEQIIQKNSIFQNHLQRLLSQSKSISESIAQAESRPGTYRNLIDSFKQMMLDLDISGLHSERTEKPVKQESVAVCSSSSHRSCKKVKFSDHIVEFVRPTDDEDHLEYHGVNSGLHDLPKGSFETQNLSAKSRSSPNALPHSNSERKNSLASDTLTKPSTSILTRSTVSRTSHDLTKQSDSESRPASSDSLLFDGEETLQRRVTIDSGSSSLMPSSSPQNLLRKSGAAAKLSRQYPYTNSISSISSHQSASLTDMNTSLSNESLHDAPVVFFLDEPTLSDDDEESLFGRRALPSFSVPVTRSDVETALRERIANHKFPHDQLSSRSSLLADLASLSEEISDHGRILRDTGNYRDSQTETGQVHSSTPSFDHRQPHLDFSDFSLD